MRLDTSRIRLLDLNTQPPPPYWTGLNPNPKHETQAELSKEKKYSEPFQAFLKYFSLGKVVEKFSNVVHKGWYCVQEREREKFKKYTKAPPSI